MKKIFKYLVILTIVCFLDQNYMNATTITYRQVEPQDAQVIKNLMSKHWGGEPLIIRGQAYYPSKLPGIFALEDTKIIGLLFYEIKNHECEIVVFEVFDKFKGIGTQMLNKLIEIAKNLHCTRIFLMTTNDDLDALRFYQRRGFHLCGIHFNTHAKAKELKPNLGDIGDYDIPIRDEIDLEMIL